eukprot:1159113-Pelagomonas_calceolata.AAC.10
MAVQEYIASALRISKGIGWTIEQQQIQQRLATKTNAQGMELLHTLFKAVNSNKLFLRCRFAVSSMTSQRAALARPPSPNKKRCCTSKDNTEEHGHTTQDMQVKHIDSDSS